MTTSGNKVQNEFVDSENVDDVKLVPSSTVLYISRVSDCIPKHCCCHYVV